MSELFVLEESEQADEGAWVAIDDDTTLQAEVGVIQRVTKPFNDKETGKPVERVQFMFVVTEDGPFHGRKLRGETSPLFNQHPNCKMRNWVQEILATDLPAGFRFDPEAVRGSAVRVLVGKKVKPRTDGKGDWVENWVKDVWRPKPATTSNTDTVVIDEEPF